MDEIEIEGITNFPLHLLKSELADLLVEFSDFYNVPPSFVFYANNVVCGSLVGGNWFVEAKDGYLINTSQYLVIVGISGAGKSPWLNHIVEKVSDVEEAIHVENSKSREELFQTSFTYESMIESLKNNPQGLLVYRDEIANIFYESSRYNKNGNETWKMFLNECITGAHLKRVTNTSGKSEIKRLVLSILGGMTPSLLRGAFNKLDTLNGLVQRFDFYYLPDRLRYFSLKEVSETADKRLFELYNSLYLNRVKSPQILQLDVEAIELWRLWEENIENLRYYNAYGIEELSGYLSKHKESPLKIVATLYHIYRALGIQVPELVDRNLMEVAITISDNLASHTIKVWELLLSDKNSLARDNLEANLLITLENLTDKENKTLFKASEIREALNSYMAIKYHGNSIEYSAQAIGKALVKLGFKSKRNADGMVYVIHHQQICDLKGHVD